MWPGEAAKIVLWPCYKNIIQGIAVVCAVVKLRVEESWGLLFLVHLRRPGNITCYRFSSSAMSGIAVSWVLR